MKTTLDIQAIKDCGFRVFQREGGGNYAYFTDGKNIGYIENGDRGLHASTVHKPNHTTGTGFGIDISDISKDELQKAFCVAPGWADSHQWASVNKFPSIEAFLKADRFNQQLREA